jgi:hypothetical protein
MELCAPPPTSFKEPSEVFNSLFFLLCSSALWVFNSQLSLTGCTGLARYACVGVCIKALLVTFATFSTGTTTAGMSCSGRPPKSVTMVERSVCAVKIPRFFKLIEASKSSLVLLLSHAPLPVGCLCLVASFRARAVSMLPPRTLKDRSNSPENVSVNSDRKRIRERSRERKRSRKREKDRMRDEETAYLKVGTSPWVAMSSSA